MGTPKQLLRIDGKTVLERTLENVRASLASEIVLVLGYAADEVEKQLSTSGIRVVRNAEYQQGMGASLRAGLAAVGAEATAALIILADQPLVQAATMNQLMEGHLHGRPQILIPTYRGFRGNPVLLDRSVFPEVQGLSGDVGCRAIFGDHTEGIRKLAVDDPGILLDIDSPADVENLSDMQNNVAEGGEIPIVERKDSPAAGLAELVLVGRDETVHTLVKLGRLMKFKVTVVDPFLRLAQIAEADSILHVLDFSLLPDARERHVVVATRGQFDEEALEQALRANATSVALLANKKRAEELKKSLRLQGVAEGKLAGIRAPAGLDIGAESPEEIALSIMAEIVANRDRQEAKKP